MFKFDFNCAKTLAILGTATAALVRIVDQTHAGTAPASIDNLTVTVGAGLLVNGLSSICSLRHFRAGEEREETLANHDIVNMIRAAWGEASIAVLKAYLADHDERSITTVADPSFRETVSHLKPDDFTGREIELRTIRDAIRTTRESLLPAPEIPQRAKALEADAVRSVLEVVREKLGEKPLPEDLEVFLASNKGIVFQLSAHTALYLKTNPHAQIAVLHFALQEADDRQTRIEALCGSILNDRTRREREYFDALETKFRVGFAGLHARIDDQFNDQNKPVLLPPFARNTRDVFSYRARKTGFTGRGAEMITLEDFLLDPAPVLWTVISGPAGTGKSRLAAELMEKAATWETGFVQAAREWLCHRALKWQRPNDTLLVFDYAGDENVDDLRGFLAKLSQAPMTPSGSRIRIILIARLHPDTPKQGIAVRICNFSDCGGEARSCRWQPGDLLHLQPVEREDALTIARNWAGNRWNDTTQADIARVIQQDPELARPLFAFLMGDAVLNGDLRGALNPVSVSSTALDRFFGHEQGECLEEAKVLWAAATACQGVSEKHLLSKAALQELLGTQPSHAQICSIQDRLRRFGALSDGRVAPAEPDFLGGLFVLQDLLSQPASSQERMKATMSFAWKNGEDPGAFIKQLTSDFIAHSSQVAATLPRDVTEESVRNLLDDLVLTGLSQEAKARQGHLFVGDCADLADEAGESRSSIRFRSSLDAAYRADVDLPLGPGSLAAKWLG